MKIIQPTLESFLQETNQIYLRMERQDGTAVVVAGGFREDGMWTEFHSRLEADPSIKSIVRHLKLIALIIKNERKLYEFRFEHASQNADHEKTLQVLHLNIGSKENPSVELHLGLN